MAKPCDSVEFSVNPFYLKTQFAGNMGIISVGGGKYFFKDHLSADINYGYIPEKVNGVTIHTFALKTAYRLKKVNIKCCKLGIYTGMSLIYGITQNTYIKYPNYFPTDYYSNPNAIHYNPFIGSSLQMPLQKKINSFNFFIEVGSIDYQINYAFENNRIRIVDILNLSFGLELALN